MQTHTHTIHEPYSPLWLHTDTPKRRLAAAVVLLCAGRPWPNYPSSSGASGAILHPSVPKVMTYGTQASLGSAWLTLACTSEEKPPPAGTFNSHAQLVARLFRSRLLLPADSRSFTPTTTPPTSALFTRHRAAACATDATRGVRGLTLGPPSTVAGWGRGRGRRRCSPRGPRGDASSRDRLTSRVPTRAVTDPRADP